MKAVFIDPDPTCSGCGGIIVVEYDTDKGTLVSYCQANPPVGGVVNKDHAWLEYERAE